VAVEIVMPRLSDSMEEGTIVQWLVAEGDTITPGQPLLEVETDKATVTHEADAGGVVLALNVGEGASVPVGAPIAVLGEPGEALPELGAPEALEAAAELGQGGSGVPPGAAARPSMGGGVRGGLARPAWTLSEASRAGRAKASPLARRVAVELGIDVSTLAGSGPQGRVIRADVERAADVGTGAGPPDGNGEIGALGSPSGRGEAGAKGHASTYELTRGQRTVARRMAESRGTVPDIELQRQVDMGEAVSLRERLREIADAVPSLNDLIVKAAALALREFPRVNGAYREATFESYERVNVGIAVAGEDALVVPVIFDADRKPLMEISAEARRLSARVRSGEISPAELGGGTFTVSNLGMYGVDSFSAVINLPQAAILAVGALRQRPIVDETGSLVARPTIILTLACDHRILYGVDGARFLARIAELLERPLALLL
jgi:pyruvate dehydrogenase E2 component (dihydrolipoamide acetyltransferase)